MFSFPASIAQFRMWKGCFCLPNIKTVVYKISFSSADSNV